MEAKPNVRFTTIPEPRSALVGRAHDVANVVALLRQDDVPLVTLTGPGGVGKTRLALRVAVAVDGAFQDGVIYVQLGSVIEPPNVVPTIARAFGITEIGAESVLESLIARIRSLNLLLVLDNVEHVIDAAPEIAELLLACRGLTILATSRETLRISDEHDYPVHPLGPAEAVELFVARSRAASPGFVMTAINAPAIAQICARLDGLPLAVELAAARTPVLTPAAQLEHLDHILPVLTFAVRDVPTRQRTMRDAIAWSYDLLDPDEQRLFRVLSVFAGGFTFAAINAIAGAQTNFNDPVATLISLVNKSMVQVVDSPEADRRFTMLHVVSEFGLEQLRLSGEDNAAYSAHASWILDITEHAPDHADQDGYDYVLAFLDQEQDNLRAALRWAITAPNADYAMRLATTTSRYWATRGLYREGSDWTIRAVQIEPHNPTSLRIAALKAAGWLARLQGAYHDAIELQQEAAALGRTLGDGMGVAAALQEQSLISMHCARYEEAVQFMSEALAIFLDCEAAGEPVAQLISVAHANMGQVLLPAGDPASSFTFATEALRRQRLLGYKWALADTLRILGDAVRESGDLSGALGHYQEAIVLAGNNGDQRYLANALAGVASIAVLTGQPERAAQLYGHTGAMRALMGAGIETWQLIRQGEYVEQTRVALSEEAFLRETRTGEALPPDLLIEFALQTTPGAQSSVPPPDSDTYLHPVDLTAREYDVLRLLVDGRTDREIAERLNISARTVGGHVTNVLGKLGVESRTAAAIAAVRTGLVSLEEGDTG